MPIHDWTKMLDGDFHHFHQRWIQDLVAALNSGLLPEDFFALSEQVTGRPIPDVVTLQTGHPPKRNSGGLAIAPPTAQVVARIERKNYAKRADRIAIRHGRGEVVSIIEIVSPGNKWSATAIRKFVEKTCDFVEQGVHMLVVDLHPPTPRDPNGIQQLICEELEGLRFELPVGKNRTAGSYCSSEAPTAYLESFGVGDTLPSLPLFLTEGFHVPAPLEATYMQAFGTLPAVLKNELSREP